MHEVQLVRGLDTSALSSRGRQRTGFVRRVRELVVDEQRSVPEKHFVPDLHPVAKVREVSAEQTAAAP